MAKWYLVNELVEALGVHASKIATATVRLGLDIEKTHNGHLIYTDKNMLALRKYFEQKVKEAE
jgi:hypothetical protein